MKEIIKYQLKARKGAIQLLLAIFGILNAAAWAAEIQALAHRTNEFTPMLAFWIPISVGVTVCTVLVMFFLCGAGHVDALLYKDTSYLMLTIPRRGWQILGGRFIAGLIEFLIYAVTAGVLLSIHLAIGLLMGENPGFTNFFTALGTSYYQVFIVNAEAVITLTLVILSVYASSGILLTTVTVASRTLVKNKGISTAIGVALFVIVTNWILKFATFLGTTLDLAIPVRFRLENAGPFRIADAIHTGTITSKTFEIPLAPFILFLLLAAALFALSSWLLEKKVEL